MPRRIAVSTLNASTIDILNTIRENASIEYQNLVPVVTTETDIPKVGEVLFGYPAMANQFINALINRIAQVRVNSATFNNQYAELKKGMLEYGETVEEVFVNIVKAREFSVEKAEAREFKRSLPDVKSAMHIMNYRVQYSITIQEEDLRMAFLSMNGVQDLIARIVDAVYTSAEYDEYLLFKYLIIKGITSGKMYPVKVTTTDIKNAAVAFRGISNQLTFIGTDYNASGVHTNTPKSDQYIFMDSMFNAQFDVNVLASAFNMEKADFMGRLKLIDSFNTFDNERFSAIIAGSDQIEPITADELALMDDVIAVVVDKEWFQIYDNLNRMSEKYVASGLYWNYFYNVWKTVSFSPFSNAVVFVNEDATTTLPNTLTVTVLSKSVSDEATVLTFSADLSSEAFAGGNANFVQTSALTEAGIAVHPYGAVIIPSGEESTSITLVADVNGTTYTAGSAITASTNVGATVTLSKA